MGNSPTPPSGAGGDGLGVQARPLVQLPAAGQLLVGDEGLRVEERPRFVCSNPFSRAGSILIIWTQIDWCPLWCGPCQGWTCIAANMGSFRQGQVWDSQCIARHVERCIILHVHAHNCRDRERVLRGNEGIYVVRTVQRSGFENEGEATTRQPIVVAHLWPNTKHRPKMPEE